MALHPLDWVIAIACILLCFLPALAFGRGSYIAQRMLASLLAVQAASSEPLVIQGRITAIQGGLMTVKTPDGYPGGGPGAHALFVMAGPSFQIDVSHTRILLPDGKRIDKLPLAVGDRVVVVVSGKEAPAPAGPGANRTYAASIVERVVQSDRIVTH